MYVAAKQEHEETTRCARWNADDRASRRRWDGLFVSRVVVGDRREDLRGRLLDAVEGLGQRVLVARIELDVVGGGGVGVEANRLGYDERNRLGFGLADRLGTANRAFTVMQEFVSEFMGQRREFLGWRQVVA